MSKLILRFSFIAFVFLVAVAPILAQRWDKVVIGEPYNSNYWLDVFFLPSNPNLGWVSGYQGMVIRTVDGGSTWQGTKVNNEPNIQLESIHFPTQNIGYTSGSKNVFKTTNGGATWTEITPVDAVNIWGCFFSSADTGVVLGGGCGSAQNFYRTTNGGLTWTDSVMMVPNSGLTDAILYSNDGLGYAVSSGWLWRTLNGGVSWTQFMPTGDKYWHEEITKIGPSFLLPVAGISCTGAGNGGGMKFTSNNGIDWINTNVADHMYGSFLLSESTGWACGLRSQMYYTSNYGQTWQLQNCGISTDLDDTYFINDSTGWVVGKSAIYRLAPAFRSVSKSALNFGDACFPGVVNDTIWVNSKSFNQSFATINLTGTHPDDFRIVAPSSANFITPACDSMRVVIQFRPTTEGNKTATVTIRLTNPSIDFIIPLTGTTKRILSFTTDTLLTFTSAPCGMLSLDSLHFSNPGLDTESIVKINRITETNPLQLLTKLPLVIPPGSNSSVKFQVIPTDTGWIYTSHQIWVGVCSRVVNVRAYGTSPIFNAQPSKTLQLSCSSYMLDTVIISNTGNAPMLIPSIQVLGKDSSDFKIIGFVGGGGLPKTVGIGKSIGVIIRFGPVTAGQQKLAILKVENNDSTLIRGRMNPSDIKLTGILSGSILSITDTLAIGGDICVGSQKSMTFTIKNIGTIPAGITKLINRERGFNFSVRIGSQVRQEDSLIVTVFFVPDREGVITDTLRLEFSPCGDKFTIALRCKGVKTILAATPNIIQEVIQSGNNPTSRTCIIQSIGSAKAVISSITLFPQRSDWRLVNLNTLPFILDSGKSLSVGVEFFAINDTLFDGKICFSSNLVCDAESCIPIKVQSIASRLSFSVSNIDFGIARCISPAKRAKFMVKNEGTSIDTINVVLLKGAPVYSIISPSNGLLEIRGDGNGLIEVEYNQQKEGQEVGTLSLWSVKKDTSRFTIPLTGSFVRTKSTMRAQSPSRTLEPCDNKISDTIFFQNMGMISDTLMISSAINQPGFEISPSDFIVIPSGGYAKAIVWTIPSSFPAVETFTQQYKFRGVCGDTFIYNTTCTIIHPKLVITPQVINFGRVLKNDTLGSILTIENPTQTSKRLISLTLESKSPNIHIDTLVTPDSFAPNSLRTYSVYCKGEVAGKFLARLLVIEESVCRDTTAIEIQVEVLDELYKSKVILDNYSVRYGDTFSIPLRLDSAITIAGVENITTEITFDFYLLSILGVERRGENIPFTTGKNISGKGFLRVSQSSTPNDQLGNMGDVFRIKVLALVSLPDTSTLTIQTFDVESKRPTLIKKIHGFLEIDIGCNPFAGLRLQPTLTAHILPPLPIRDAIKIELTSTDEQTVHLNITDCMGVERFVTKEVVTTSSSILSISTDNFPAGVYFLTLSSMGKITREKIVLVR